MHALRSPAGEAPRGWRAQLSLRYRRDGQRTLVGRSHDGPLVVQRSLYPEGPELCQNIVVHPPGGIAGGDELAIDVVAESGSRAQLTTPGATKWYRSEGAQAMQTVSMRVAEDAAVEWLPQEAIVFERARARQRVVVELAAAARYVGWEVFCLGRTAAGERFDAGVLEAATELRVDGEPRWVERARIEGGSRMLDSRAGLAGARVFGTLLAFAQQLPAALAERCRSIAPAAGEGAVSIVDGVLVARILGGTTETARQWFAALWACLRPELIGRPAVPPRIWRT